MACGLGYGARQAATLCRHPLSFSTHPHTAGACSTRTSLVAAAPGRLTPFAPRQQCSYLGIHPACDSQGLGAFSRATRSLATSSRPRSHYEILRVPRTATAAEIKRAYLREAKKCHPDIDSSPDATVRFKQLAQAYQVLKDPNARAHYDRWGEQQQHQQASSSAGSGARRSGSYSTADSQPPPPPGPDIDPFDLFKAVLEELGSEVIVEYWGTVQKEASHAMQKAKEGDLQPAKDFAYNHKVLFGVTVVPTVVLLRFPWVIGAAFRFAAAVVALLLQSRATRQMVGRFAWLRWSILLSRARERARQQKGR